MIILEEHLVPGDGAGSRLMDFATRLFEHLPSRAAARKAIKRGEVLVDGEPAKELTLLEEGQKISLIDTERNHPPVLELKLEVLMEDDHLAVVFKPAGLPVSGNRHKTLANALPFNLEGSAEKDVLKRPRPAHRLDVPTSGLVLVAKTARSLMTLGAMFQQRRIGKCYRAVVAGQAGSGEVSLPVEGKEALTAYRQVRQVPSLKTGFLTLVDLFPRTGRKHQLRIHMAAAGHPIVGDQRYTEGKPLLQGKGLFLAAVGLAFDHPVTGTPVKVETAQPEKFDALLEREERRWKKYRG